MIFLIKKIIKFNNEELIHKENPYKGILIKKYLDFLIYNYEKAWDVQAPPKNFQIINFLKPTTKVNDLYLKVRQRVNTKHFVAISKKTKCLDKKEITPKINEIFIKKLVDDLNLGVFICGTPEGVSLSDFKYNNVYNTVFEKEELLLDLHISLLCNSKYSIHSQSGSAYLSMYTGNFTFFLV